MNAIFLATASCSPIGRPHWTRSADHSLAIFSASFAGRGAARGQGEAAGVQRGEGDLEALALLADAVPGRDPDLVEPGDARSPGRAGP